MSRPNSPAERPQADDLVERLSTAQLEELLRGIAAGREPFAALVLAKYPRTPSPPEPGTAEASETVHHFGYALLKLLGDDRRSRPHWAALAEPGGSTLERPEVVLRLWRLFETGEGRAYLRRHQRSVAYHRRRFFEWFLGGYDLRLARGILLARDRAAIRTIHFLLLAGMLAVAALHLGVAPAAAGGSRQAWTLALVPAVYLAVALGQVMSFRSDGLTAAERWILAGQSLVPRLAAASVVGLVLLASSEELLAFVVRGASPWRAAVLLAASFVYLLLEMARRIHPLPRTRRLLRLGGDVAVTAFAHGLAIAVCAERPLRSILDPPRMQVLSPWQLLNVAAFLLAIGLIVNLIWAEEPVTQPL